MKQKKSLLIEPRIAPIDRLKPPKDIPSINDLADKMIEWVYSTDVYNIADFPLSLRISPYHFYKCATVSGYFDNALTVAKYVIASRILKGWREGHITQEYATKELFRYDPEFKKEYMEVRVLTAQKVNDSYSGAKFIIETPQIPNSDKVRKLS